MRYCLCLSYDGSSFCGWQIQPNAPSVQATLESTLTRLLNRPVAVTGAGRTDTSVHAVHYMAHFDYDTELPFGQSDFCYKLNAMLPCSIVIHSVTPVPDYFHARFSARRREYTYFLHRRKDPFLQAYSWQCGYPELDFDAMNQACQHLLGTHDFSCFEKTGGDNKTSLCTVFDAFWAPYTPSHVSVMGLPEVGGIPEIASASLRPLPDFRRASPDSVGPSPLSGRGWPEISGTPPTSDSEPSATQSDCHYWYFRIAADRFLRNMVRATVGSLIEVGRGKHGPEWIAELIESGTRGDAGESVPGHALFLNKVQY